MAPSLHGRKVPIRTASGQEAGDLQALCSSIRQSIANMVGKKPDHKKPWLSDHELHEIWEGSMFKSLLRSVVTEPCVDFTRLNLSKVITVLVLIRWVSIFVSISYLFLSVSRAWRYVLEVSAPNACLFAHCIDCID